MKRLRFHINKPIRYYYVGEYGSRTNRPHYHAIIFGHNFNSDKYLWQKSPSGFDLYRSATLESLWSRNGVSLGYTSVADVTFDSAAYCARYCMKKIGGDLSKTHYAVFDLTTGEYFGARLPEFANMSTDGGIGKSWFEQYQSDVFPNDSMLTVKNGKVIHRKVPAYYNKLFERVNPAEYEIVKEKRLLKMEPVSEDRLPAVRKCYEARAKLLVRNLE